MSRLRWLPFDALVWIITRFPGVAVTLPATHPRHDRSRCHECRLVDAELFLYNTCKCSDNPADRWYNE